jgi:hypothetical protein
MSVTNAAASGIMQVDKRADVDAPCVAKDVVLQCMPLAGTDTTLAVAIPRLGDFLKHVPLVSSNLAPSLVFLAGQQEVT